MPSDSKTYWEYFEKERESFEKRMLRIVTKGLKDSVQPFIDELKITGDLNAEPFVKDEPIMDATVQVWQFVGVHFADLQYHALMNLYAKRSQVEDIWLEAIDRYIRRVGATRVKGINEFTRQTLKDMMRQGVELGLSIDDVVTLIRQSEAMNVARATRIARTEIVGASNRGALIGAKSTGLDLVKEWIATASQPDRTRPTHLEADGQTRDIDEPFTVGGYHGQYPGDPQLPPEEVINCRCTHAFRRVAF